MADYPGEYGMSEKAMTRLHEIESERGMKEARDNSPVEIQLNRLLSIADRMEDQLATLHSHMVSSLSQETLKKQAETTPMDKHDRPGTSELVVQLDNIASQFEHRLLAINSLIQAIEL